MTDAPERIWADPGVAFDWDSGTWGQDPYDEKDVEYLRADLSPQWQPIETATRDADILVWFDHEADPYQDPNNPAQLTDYGSNAEGGEFIDGAGVTVAKWNCQVWESIDEYGAGYWLPAGWFSRGDFGNYEVVVNATHWMPLPKPPTE